MDKQTATEQRVVLPNVGWQQFERLLTELGTARTTRLTYANGRLELIKPTDAHRRCDRLIESLILLLSDQMELSVSPVQKVMLMRSDAQIGVEPDTCYFFGNLPSESCQRIDPRDVAPPELAVHLCIAPSTVEVLPLYAQLGISEVWQYVASEDSPHRGALKIYQTDAATQRYGERTHSIAFPFLAGDRVAEFITHSDTVGLASALQVVRSWLQQQGLSREF